MVMIIQTSSDYMNIHKETSVSKVVKLRYKVFKFFGNFFVKNKNLYFFRKQTNSKNVAKISFLAFMDQKI